MIQIEGKKKQPKPLNPQNNKTYQPKKTPKKTPNLPKNLTKQNKPNHKQNQNNTPNKKQKTPNKQPTTTKMTKEPPKICLPIPEPDFHFTENEILLDEFLFATITQQLTFKPAA